MKKLFFLLLTTVGLFFSCSSPREKEQEKLGTDLNITVNDVYNTDRLMMSELVDAGMVGFATTGKFTFLDDESVKNNEVHIFVLWENNDGGYFLSTDYVPNLTAIKKITETFPYTDVDSYVNIDRDNDTVSFTILIGEEKDEIKQLDQIIEFFNLFEKIADTEKIKVWKDFKKPKGKSTITFE